MDLLLHTRLNGSFQYTMWTESPDHIPLPSDRHESDIEAISSAGSDDSTIINNTKVIQILLESQPFILYDDPSATQDIVVI